MPPWLLLALLITLISSLVYQIVRRSRLRRVLLYWAVTLTAFLGGQALSELGHLQLPPLGELQIVPDLIAVVLVLAVLWLLRL